MRLMSSQNRDEVEVVKNELQKAGIASETRCNPVAKSLGVNGVELWVADGRDFPKASRLYAQIRGGGGSGKPGGNAGNGQSPPAQRLIGAGELDSGKHSASSGEVWSGREELNQAKSLLEKGLEDMFQRESELSGECASLRSKVEELSQALAQGQAALKRESEGRAALERNHVEQIAGMERALDRERQEWQKQMQSRDELLKKTLLKLESASRLLEAQQSAMAALRDEIVCRVGVQ
jgi:hypothetical protein